MCVSGMLCRKIAHVMAGAEVELEGGQKLRAKMVVCADGVHSKTAAKYHKAPLQFTNIIGWRRALPKGPNVFSSKSLPVAHG